MELLKKAILEKGRIKNGDVLKVDGFLNHQIDVDLLDKIGEEFYNRFKNEKITKILTIEASGIAIAVITAQHFKVPVVFAKKTQSKNIDGDVYSSSVVSFTRGQTYDIIVSSKYISSDDRVLIIDDFLAKGSALSGLINIVNQAGASIAGCGIVIEKGFDLGSSFIRSKGIRVESLAIIQEMSENGIIFK